MRITSGSAIQVITAKATTTTKAERIIIKEKQQQKQYAATRSHDV